MLWWLAQNAVLGAVLALLVAVVCRLGHFRPAVRHALWLVVLVKLVAPPLIPWPWPAPVAGAVVARAGGVGGGRVRGGVGGRGPVGGGGGGGSGVVVWGGGPRGGVWVWPAGSRYGARLTRSGATRRWRNSPSPRAGF